MITGFIRRSFSYLSCKLFKKLYVTFVRPHLEYAQAVWSPNLKKYINLIENVQIRATKYVDGFKDLDYPDILRKLELPTLMYRRARGDMIEIFKHFHVYDKSVISESFRPKERVSRKHDFQLYNRTAKDGVGGIRNNSFYYRSVNTWNNLPRNVVNAKHITTTMLDKRWGNEPWKFNHEERLIDS